NAVAIILIVGAGLVHGAWTNRWGRSAALATLVQRFESVPMVIGDWKATALELPARERVLAGAEAWLVRAYVNSSRGIAVTVVLLGGLPGDIATHTPDVCYPSAGYGMNAPESFKSRYGPQSRPAEFQTARSVREGTSPSVLRLFWSW